MENLSKSVDWMAYLESEEPKVSLAELQAFVQASSHKTSRVPFAIVALALIMAIPAIWFFSQNPQSASIPLPKHPGSTLAAKVTSSYSTAFANVLPKSHRMSIHRIITRPHTLISPRSYNPIADELQHAGCGGALACASGMDTEPFGTRASMETN